MNSYKDINLIIIGVNLDKNTSEKYENYCRQASLGEGAFTNLNLLDGKGDHLLYSVLSGISLHNTDCEPYIIEPVYFNQVFYSDN